MKMTKKHWIILAVIGAVLVFFWKKAKTNGVGFVDTVKTTLKNSVETVKNSASANSLPAFTKLNSLYDIMTAREQVDLAKTNKDLYQYHFLRTSPGKVDKFKAQADKNGTTTEEEAWKYALLMQN